MKNHPVPSNEKQRLKALKSYNILDTQTEKEFDEIVELASSIAGVPIALISIIDENRQWFKSRKGTDVTETPRNISFCQYAILDYKIYEIEDATKVDIFKDNPLVTSNPYIRFYAGAPLTDPNGYNLGTLCVIDDKPKKLTEQQKSSLQLLAKSVITLLLLKKQNAENAIITQRLLDAQSIAKVGNWEFDLESNDLTWSKEHYKIFELDENIPSDKLYEAYRSRIDSEDLTRLDKLIAETVATGKGFEFLHRVVLPDGKKKYALGITEGITNNFGKIQLIKGTVQDVTDQILKEEELEEAQTISQVASFTRNILTNDLKYSKEFYKLFEIDLSTPKEKLFDEYLKKIHPEDVVLLKQKIENLWKTGEGYMFEYRLVFEGNRIKYVNGISTSLNGAKGNIVGIRGTIQNITERKVQELEKERLVREVETYFNTTQDLICILTKEGSIIKSVNSSFLKELGYSVDEVIGLSIRNFVHQDDIDSSAKTADKVRAGASSTDFENRVRKKNGEYIWLSWKSFLDKNSNNIYASGRNVTQKKESDKKLSDTINYLSAILNSSDYSIISTRTDGIITHFNSGAVKMLGYTAGEMIDKLTPAVLHDKDEVVNRAKILSIELDEKIEPGFDVFIAKTKRNGLPDQNEWTYVRKDGKKFPVSLSVTAVQDNANTIVGYLGIAKDITAEKERIKQILAAKEAAENYAKVKQEFLANMSHEIRTPMNAILGFTQLMLKQKLSAEQFEFITALDSSSKNLLAIINDILDVSKLESGKLILEKIEFDFKTLLNELVSFLKPIAKQKGIKIILEFDKRIPNLLMGDTIRLNQVLTNLLSNAIKFTEYGIVELGLRLLVKKDNLCVIHFEIKDTGIGIDSNKLDLIFESFTQENSDTTRNYGGTGLGLFIAQNIVKNMGGEIRVESEKGKGSNFHFSLSFEFKEQKISPNNILNNNQAHKNEPVMAHVLLTDDNNLNQKLIGAYLKQIGCSFDLATDGLEALAMLNKQKYDVVLMDVQMPNMDGIEATQKIRELKNNTPIIAITANAFQEEKEKCLKAGMNKYLSKPFKMEQLKDLITSVLKSKSFVVLPAEKKTVNNEINKFDFSLIKDNLGDDDAIIKEFLSIFKTMLNEFKEKLKTDDYEALRQAAHKISPSCSMLGLTHLNSLTHELEQMAIDKQPFDKVKSLINNIVTNVNNIIPQIDSML